MRTIEGGSSFNEKDLAAMAFATQEALASQALRLSFADAIDPGRTVSRASAVDT